MTYLVCGIVFAVVFGICYLGFVRPLQRQFAELKRAVSADCTATRGQVKVTLGRVEMLRKNSGAELEAVSERLYKVEERKTTPCEMN